MRRVVVFMGGSRDVVAAMQHSLPSAVEALARAGVLVPRSGRSGNKTIGFSHQPLGNLAARGWTSAQAEVGASPAETVLLVIPAMLRIGGSTSRRLEMLGQLSTLGDEVVLVSVVGEQLTTINDFYLSRVAAWRMSRRLDVSAPRLLDNEAFVHEMLLRPWYEQSAARYVAVPLPVYTSGHPIATVLSAAGARVDAELPRAVVPDLPKLGSVGVEANRLVATYLRAEIPGFTYADEGVAAASVSGLSRAQKLGWCDDQFWGWTPRSVEQALARYDASNHRFASTVWGTDWTLPYPVDRPCTQADFLDLDFAVVDQVHRYVIGMAAKVARERKAAT
ncbi:MAG: hypothetical protein ACR2JU_08610 [Nocardioidaceae bacterium]